MKGTYFVVDMDELVDFADTVKSEMILLEESLGDFENSIAALVGMDSFQGESAEAVKQYFDEVYSTIISGIYLCCDDMRAASSLYLEKYLEVDSNRNALIGEEAMYNLNRDVKFYVSALLSEIDIINNAINKVDDFAAVEKLSRNKLEEYSEDETRFINKKRAKVEQIESNMMNGTIKKAKDMVNSTSKIINNYKNNIKSLETYKSGDFSKVDGIDDYIKNLNRSKKFLEDNSDKINEAERIVDEMSTSKKIAKEKQDNLCYTLWHMFCNAPVHVIDKAEDAFLKLYGNAEKISWLPGPVKSHIRGFTGDASKGYGNNLFEIKYGIEGAIARGGLDFVLESAKGVFELAEEAPHLVMNVGKEGFKLFFNPKEVVEDAKNTKDKVVAIAKSVPSKLDDCCANFLKKNGYEKISAITKEGLDIYFIVQSGKKLLKDAKKVKNITKTTQTIKVSTEVEEISKLTKEAEKTSKLVKETETTLGATIIESVKAAEQAGEEAKVVSGIDRAKDTLERLEKLKKWEEPGVDELKITKTGETVKVCLKAPSKCNISLKQFGKKWGKHKFDYLNLNMDEYKELINRVFNNPEKIIYDAKNQEYLYLRGNDLLRVTETGDFISLYPGAETGRVKNAIENGGVIWQK